MVLKPGLRHFSVIITLFSKQKQGSTMTFFLSPNNNRQEPSPSLIWYILQTVPGVQKGGGNVVFSACRQSLYGTSFLQTTWTQTLWSGAGLGWRTSCSVWPLIQFSPTTRCFTTSSPRCGMLFLCFWSKYVSYRAHFLKYKDVSLTLCGRSMAGRKWCMRRVSRQRYRCATLLSVITGMFSVFSGFERFLTFPF